MMPKKKESSEVNVGNGLKVIAYDEKSKEYAEAIPLVREMIEVATNRNMESFSLHETLKIRPITLTLTKMVAERKINLGNWQEESNKGVLDELLEIVVLKLKEAGVIG